MDQREVTQIAMQAAGVAKKGLMLKVGAAAAVLFFAALLILGGLMPLSNAQASSRCEDAGPGKGISIPDGDPDEATGSLRQKQLRYAKTIDKAAKKVGLPGKATLIALMTAMQESTLQNLDHGPPGVDAIGLFQQRPSMNWGTKKQIMTPSFAAHSFFAGRGTNKGLKDIPGWQKMPMHKAAEAVQHSGQGELYAGHESAMRRLARDAGIDLERGGSPTGRGNSPGKKPVTSQNVGCGNGKPKPIGGSKFNDGRQAWKLTNPRSVKEAIAWARRSAGPMSERIWYNRCLAYTAIVYGWNFSGVNYAIDHFTVVPKQMRHRDRNPPPGALMYWDTGHRAGHIAVYLGGGKIASNDIMRPGYIDIVQADLIEAKWRAKYVGWTPPYFPRAG
ncbi:peptidase M23 [Streptomyces sp. NPDC053474]|uniref:peptidase M23 n=1 Tax=Streptomyces sp. NPDC053474 TaxID=3365704 RepID=UPI0037CEE762